MIKSISPTMTESRLFLLATLLALFAFGANQFLSRAPAVVSVDAPSTSFSGARAMGLLEHLLQENEAHPTGSAANRRVKARILEWLEAEGFETEVQAVWGCATSYNGCAWVENILAFLPGTETDQPYVALMAHYDSVPSAPGAGDDGAGVVAVLETARAIKAVGPQRNPLMLLITDAEEQGLIGAEAFFKFHPLASRVGVILNVEGSGTKGPSMVLRTTTNNASFMGYFREGANYPSGASLANEVFKRMPNDTDFSVSMRNGVPGIDFAFAFERSHYHTPNDNVANLDPRTVQHHGENLLPTALRLVGADLGESREQQVVYQGLYGMWLQWAAPLSWWLLALAAVLLMIAARGSHVSWRKLAVASVIAPPVILLCACLVAFASFWLLDKAHGITVSWPAELLPYRMVLFASILTTGMVVSAFFNRHMSVFIAVLGAWVFWLTLTLVAQIMLPGAANLLLIPLLPAALLLLLASRKSIPDSFKTGLLLLTLVAVMPLVSLVIILEQTQGYRLIASTFLFLGLLSISFGPFVRGALSWRARQLGGLTLVAGLVAASVMPLFSAWRPQPVNIQYIQNADDRQAYWRLVSFYDLPERMLAQADFSLPATQPYPWTTRSRTGMANAPVIDLAAPQLQVLSDQPLGEGRRVVLKLSSERGARLLQLSVQADSRLLRAQLGGNELDVSPGLTRFLFYGVQSRDVEITLDFADSVAVTAYILDTSSKLPGSAAGLLESRAPLATPVHSGDEAQVFRQVSF